MDGHQFDRLLQALAVSPSRRRAVRLLVGAVGGGMLSLTTRSLDAKKGAKTKGKVTICHKGQTITIAQSALPAHLRHGDSTGACGAAKCLALGAPCVREQPWDCCSGSCRPAGTEKIPYHLIRWPADEPPLCADMTFGCTRADDSCGETELSFCPDLVGSHCHVTVEDQPFCGWIGSRAACQYCESDQECGAGSRCVECAEPCGTEGTSNRGCYREGTGPAA
jgi:hypothetical protein